MAKSCHQIDEHHRKPLHQGGKDIASNVAYVNRKKHRGFHTCFDRHDENNCKRPATANEVVEDLNKFWIDPAYEVILVEREVKVSPNQLRLDIQSP